MKSCCQLWGLFFSRGRQFDWVGIYPTIAFQHRGRNSWNHVHNHAAALHNHQHPMAIWLGGNASTNLMPATLHSTPICKLGQVGQRLRRRPHLLIGPPKRKRSTSSESSHVQPQPRARRIEAEGSSRTSHRDLAHLQSPL